MRNITKTGYEALTIVRSLNDPTIGFGLDISPALWINECKDTKFFVFAPQGCINQIYELSAALNDYIDGIITPCGNLIPINNKIEFLDSEGIGLECIEGKLKFVIKAPLDPSLGGTGQIIYKDGDLLVGNQDGKLSILIKGEIGQVVGVKEDGSLGFITSSTTAPIQKFSVSPCGELTPDSVGKVGLELSEDFTCELSEDKSTSKIGLKEKPASGITKIITSCGEITPIDGVVKFTTGEGLDSTCQQNEVTNKLKVPVDTTLGGTGQTEYNENDLLIGDNTGKLKKLPKGETGQVLGVKEDGSVGYIPVSTDAPIKKFSVSPCGDLIPTTEGKIGLELSSDFDCELNEDKSTAKVRIKSGGATKKVVAATARFPVTSISWFSNGWYPLGSQGNTAYIKIRDQDGDNFQANNLSVGSGTTQDYLMFTVPYSGLWAISYQATFEVNNLDRETFIQHSLAWGKSYETAFKLREFDSFSSSKRKSVVGTKILPIEKGDIIFIEVNIGRDPSDPNLQVTMRSFWNPPSFDSYVGFGLIEEGNVTAPTMEVL